MAHEVSKTYAYEKFSFLGQNRNTERAHVESLKVSIQDNPHLQEALPVLVNENFEIIDGQHRYVACKELDRPIYYTMVKGLNIKDALTMNVTQRRWDVNDYAESYAKQGIPVYQQYLRLKEEYGFAHSIMLVYIAGTYAPKNMFRQFREANLVIEDEAAVRQRLDQLSEFRDHLPEGITVTRDFARAYLIVLSSENYNHKRMIEQLKRYGNRIELGYRSTPDLLRAFEALYNYRRSTQITRLY